MAFIDMNISGKISRKLLKERTPGEQFLIAETLISNLIKQDKLKDQLGFDNLINSMMDSYQRKKGEILERKCENCIMYKNCQDRIPCSEYEE